MKQVSLGLNLSTKKTRKREFLEQMNKVVPWDGPSSFRVETNGDNRWWS